MSGVLVLQPFVVSWIKEQSIYCCTVLVSQGSCPVAWLKRAFFSTRAFKRAILKFDTN